MAPSVKLFLALMALFGGYLLYSDISEFLQVDACLDAGGCWLAKSKDCEFVSQERCAAERPGQ